MKVVIGHWSFVVVDFRSKLNCDRGRLGRDERRSLINGDDINRVRTVHRNLLRWGFQPDLLGNANLDVLAIEGDFEAAAQFPGYVPLL